MARHPISQLAKSASVDFPYLHATSLGPQSLTALLQTLHLRLDVDSDQTCPRSTRPMSRSFSTAVRAWLQFRWKGTDPVAKYEDMIKDKLAKNPKLKDIDEVVIAGQEHNSPKDKANRVSGQLFKESTRVTSVHAYADERVIYSKEEYNDAQEE